MQKRHRIFIAINLPGDIKKLLARKEQQWKEIPAKWVEEENLHITLVFLGDLTDIELGEAVMAVKSVAAQHEPFEIKLEKIAYGPDEKIPPKFIWVSGQKSKELSVLKNGVQDALLEKINFLPEHRAFTPHVTLARIKTMEWRAIEPEERPQVEESIDVGFTVESIEVMESHLAKSGPQYTVIESFPLAES